MAPLKLSAEHARRFLVRRKLLDPPRSLPPTKESVLSVVTRLGSLQFDPLAVPGAKNHELVLHARIQGDARALCDGLLYAPRGERRLFEAYNKSLNILPVEEMPYHRITWERAEERYRERVFAARAAAVSAVEQRLRDEGPLFTTAFTRDLGAPVDWHWAPTAEGRVVVEALFECGRVGIARRDGSLRAFDLIERLFPAELLEQRVPAAEAMRHRLLSRYRGVGLLGQGASAEITLRAGDAAARAAMTAALVKDGTLVAVEVEGVRGLRYMLAEERSILDAAAAPASAPGVSFIAPLDPLLWDRRLLRDLFEFAYKWEVYTPEAKRQHGYYVLPILFGDRLVGRIEPRFDRKSAVLTIAGLWFEAWFEPLTARGFADAFAEALVAYTRFVGAKEVRWPRTKVARALARASGMMGNAP